MQKSLPCPKVSIQHSKCIALFDDYAIYEKGNARNSAEGNFHVGKLQRMLKKGRRGFIEYREPITFNSEQVKDVEGVLQLYKPTSVDRQYITGGRIVTTKLNSLLCQVNLEYCPEENTFTLPVEEKINLNELVLGKRPRRQEVRQAARQEAEVADDGMVRLTVPPQDVNASGLRRSKRERTVRLFLD